MVDLKGGKIEVVEEMAEEDIPTDSWTLLSEESFARDWSNDDDAIYDDWRELYGVFQ